MSKSNTYAPECYTLLRRYGYTYDSVERWVTAQGRGWRKDFLGFGDILAFRYLPVSDPNSFDSQFDFRGVLCVQACAENAIQAHLRKVTEGEPRQALREWLLSGNRFEIWGFPNRHRKSRFRVALSSSGKRTRVLNTRMVRLTYEHLDGSSLIPQFCQENTTELTAFGYSVRHQLGA